jgi:hypothetical protein
MVRSFSALLDQALAESGVAIFGILDLDGEDGAWKTMAEQHVEHGADFLDVRTSGERSSRPEGEGELRLILEHLANRYPGRLCMLGDLQLPVDERALKSLSLVRRTKGDGRSSSDLVDQNGTAMVGWSCSSPPSSFWESLARLKALRSVDKQTRLHLSIPRPEVEEGTREEGILATQVALAVIEGATLLSVHDVRSAVKARDEIVKIQHAS